MATVIGVGMQMTASAAGMTKGLSEADRALKSLQGVVTATGDKLKQFGDSSSAAAQKQQQFATDVAFLNSALRTGQVTTEQYRKEMAALVGDAQAASTAFQRGIEVTQQYTTAEELRATQLQEIADLLKQEAISAETAARARAELSGANEAAAAAEKQLAADKQAAARIIEANLSSVERAQRQYDAAIAEAQRLERSGLLTKQDLRSEIERQAQVLAKVTVEANRAGDAVGTPTLKFNELSGVLAALPGPLGNFAGRLSGLASASEGLTRIFATGVQPGLQSLGASLAGLANPATLAVAGLAGFAAAATGVVRGLADLEGRLESLGNTALRLGTDFQTIQVLAEAAQRTGQGVEAVAAGLQRFNVNVAEARKGSGQAAEAFAALGISQERLRTADTPGLAKEVADALQRIEDPAKRAAVAVDVLGKNGLALLPVFNALQESQNALERFAAGISNVDQQRVSSLGTAFDNVKTSLAGFGQAVILPFAGVVEGFANLIADAIGAATRLAQAIGAVLTPVLDTFGKGLSLVGDGIYAVTSLFDGWLGNTRNAQAEVDRLRESVEEPLNAGFAKEFEQTLQRITSSVSDAINESAKFGQAGFDAALRYQNAVDDLRDKLDAGLFNEETFRREAAKAGEAFKSELARIEQDAQIEIQIDADAQKALASLNQQINKAADDAAKFGQSGFDAAAKFQDKLRELGQQFERGQINATTLANEAARATEEYGKQVEGLKQAEELQRRLVEQQKSRVDELIRQQDETTQLERDISTVLSEQLRLEQEIQQQRNAGNVFAADAATARLAQLDQLRARLEDQQAAFEQGFGDGFTKAFEATDKAIKGVIATAAEFGNAGAEAAQQFQEGVARVQQQARDGILNSEGYQQEIERQRTLFEQQISAIKIAEEERLAAAQRVEDFLRQGINARQQAEIAASKEREEREKQAARNVAAIRQKILEEEARNERARQDGNLKEARNSANTLRQLRGLQREEERIAKGAAGRVRQALTQATTQQNDSFDQFASAATQQITKFNDAISSSVNDINSAMAASADGLRKIAREERASMTLGPQQVAVSDVRTAEGQQMILDAAAQYQDPALIQMRQSNALLKQINQGLVANLNRIGLPAVIA